MRCECDYTEGFDCKLCNNTKYEGWNCNSGNYLFTTDTKWIHVSKFYCPSV